MPLYEYECEGCRAVTETIRKHDVESVECPECGGEARRLMSASNYTISGYCARNGYA